MKWVRVMVVSAVFLAVGLLGATTAIGAGSVEDTFTGLDGDPWDPAIWTDDDLDGGQSTIQGNEGQLEVADANDIARQLADGVPHNDFNAVFKQRFAGGFDEDKRFGFEFRRSSDWSTVNPDAPKTGYQLHHQQKTDRVVLYRFDSDGSFQVLGDTGGINRTLTYWFRVRAVGDSIKVRWWEDGTTEPLDSWNFEITDATYLTGEAFSFSHWRGDGSNARQAIIDDLTITVTNSAPVAGDDADATDEDTELVVAAPGVLGDDTDADGDPLTALKVSDPSNGTVTLSADGSFTYTPDADFSGSDSFTYVANDGSVDSNVATVDITIHSVNDAPVAVDDAYAVDEDTTLTVDDAGGVLANDTDVDGDTLSVASNTNPTNGSLTLNADGSLEYTPNADFNGPDSFTYETCDPSAACDTAFVEITVDPVNDAPVADAGADQSVSVGDLVNLDGSGSTDVDGDTLTYAWTIASAPSGSAATLTNSDTINPEFTPDVTGDYTIELVVNDGALNSDPDTVTITATDVPNSPPTADNDSYTVDEDNTLTVAAPGVLGNDSDADGDSLSAVLWDGPSNGSVTLNADGSFTYTPDADFFGSDSFTYKANDGAADSKLATVSITVDEVADASFVDVDDSIFEQDILWLAGVGITKGCNPPENDEFCPDDNVTRGQMAAFFVRALGLTDRLDDQFVDDDGNTFEADIEKLAAAGITKGCNPPENDEFCPDDNVTRGQMAAFFHRAADLLGLPA